VGGTTIKAFQSTPPNRKKGGGGGRGGSVRWRATNDGAKKKRKSMYFHTTRGPTKRKPAKTAKEERARRPEPNPLRIIRGGGVGTKERPTRQGRNPEKSRPVNLSRSPRGKFNVSNKNPQKPAFPGRKGFPGGGNTASGSGFERHVT